MLDRILAAVPPWQILIAVFFVWVLLGKLQRRRAGRRTVENMKQLYTQRHEYRDVRPDDFKQLDLDFYEQTTRVLSSLGCVWVADIEDVTIRNAFPYPVTFIRNMHGLGGAVMVGIYHCKFRSLFMRLVILLTRTKIGRSIDCETEFRNGEFLCTNNAPTAAHITNPPQLNTEYLAFETPAAEVFQRHLQRLNAYLAANPGVQPLLHTTREAIREAQWRQQQIKAAYRKQVGWVTRDEIQGMATPGQRHAASALADEVERINRDEQRKDAQ